MPLTPLQKRYIRALLKQQETGPSLGRVLAQSKIFLIVHLCLVVLGVVLMSRDDRFLSVIGGIELGIAIGSFARFVGTIRTGVRLWPVSRELIDWDKVREFERSANGEPSPIPSTYIILRSRLAAAVRL